MKTKEGFRSEAMTAALEEALSGRGGADRLWKQLALASGLPGPRMNANVAVAFANECAMRGKPAYKLALRMARLTAEEAPGATEVEFLPVCGVVALGAFAAAESRMRADVLPLLHDAAEDLRFRVRDAVAIALARVGGSDGDAVLEEVRPWMDGFFQSAAVLRAIADASWLPAIHDAPSAVARLDEAFTLAKDAPRSATRWPGWKALVEELARVPAAVAARFGVPVFGMLASWASTTIPELRDVIEKNLRDKKLAGRFHAEIDRVRAALDASAPVPRDPTILVQGMRSRGKKRQKRRR